MLEPMNPYALWARDGFPELADVNGTLSYLVAALASPDPDVRDAIAYEGLATWIERGTLDNQLSELGSIMAERLSQHPEVQATTFAALILASILDRDTTIQQERLGDRTATDSFGGVGSSDGVLDPEAIRTWLRTFVTWYPSEAETTGWTSQRGWLHAVAHGADLLAVFAQSPHIGRAEIVLLLEAAVRRMTAPTDIPYLQQEEDRLAFALTFALAHPQLAQSDVIDWLIPLQQLFEQHKPGQPYSTPENNSAAVMKALYILADQTPSPHHHVLKHALSQLLHAWFAPYPE